MTVRSFVFPSGLITVLLAGASAMGNPVRCEYGDLVRRVEVVYAEPGQAAPCEVIYDKSGEGRIETLWRAMHEAGYCEARAQELVDKLNRLGWSCAETETEAIETDTP